MGAQDAAYKSNIYLLASAGAQDILFTFLLGELSLSMQGRALTDIPSSLAHVCVCPRDALLDVSAIDTFVVSGARSLTVGPARTTGLDSKRTKLYIAVITTMLSCTFVYYVLQLFWTRNLVHLLLGATGASSYMIPSNAMFAVNASLFLASLS